MDGKEKNDFFHFSSKNTNLQSARNLAMTKPAIITMIIMV